MIPVGCDGGGRSVPLAVITRSRGQPLHRLVFAPHFILIVLQDMRFDFPRFL